MHIYDTYVYIIRSLYVGSTIKKEPDDLYMSSWSK